MPAKRGRDEKIVKKENFINLSSNPKVYFFPDIKSSMASSLNDIRWHTNAIAIKSSMAPLTIKKENAPICTFYIDGVPLRVMKTKVTFPPLPERKSGIFYIVDEEIATACAERDDFLFLKNGELTTIIN